MTLGSPSDDALKRVATSSAARVSRKLVLATALIACAGAGTAARAAQDDTVRVVRANGALLRGLDKISGTTTDFPLRVGDSVDFGRLTVRLGECRQPAADPDSDAFAQMTITDREARTTPFSGWMVASSPALSALDDARYDIWVVNCNDGQGADLPDLVYEPDTTPQPADAGEGGPAPGEVVDQVETGDDPAAAAGQRGPVIRPAPDGMDAGDGGGADAGDVGVPQEAPAQ